MNDAARESGRPAGPALARKAPLSFAQQRPWLLDRLRPGEATHNEAIALRVAGALDADALRGALNKVVRWHEALRTRFVVEDAAPVQVVASALELARFWEEVLVVAPVGVDDDFFELGGESLHAFALIARVADEWGVALAPRDLFACPSVGAMAAVVATKRSQR